MDIQYLLWLQYFRLSINDALTPFMEWVSMFATTYLIYFAVFYYWNRDKRAGLYTLTSYFICIMITPLIKLTACVYRPWIRDSRIMPAGDSIRTATGYSFPSGHTTTAAPLAGGMAINLWKNRRTRWASVLFAVYIFATGFSRNYLGVHTPQDVLVALILSAACLYATAKLFTWLAEHPEKENQLLLGGFVFCCLALVYITFKPYPMELNAQGALIVDPQKMMNDGYGDLGKMMGFLIARYAEKTWVRFRPPENGWGGIALCLIGLVPMVFLKRDLSPLMVAAFGSHWGKLFFSIVYCFYYIALFPMIIKLFEKMTATAHEGAGD